MKLLFFNLILHFGFVVPLLGDLIDEEQVALRRIYAHLLIHDPFSATAEAVKALKDYPLSFPLHLAYIQALVEKGDECAAFQEWNQKKEGDLKSNRRILETLAWGVLKKGNRSPQLNVSLNAVIGAALTRDVKAIPFLVHAMRGTNALLRLVAVRFVPSYGDAPLQEELARMVVEEKVWFVRLEVIRAIGALRIFSLYHKLKELIENSRTSGEEKEVAILALVQMHDGISEADLNLLIRSNRVGLRQLACQLVAHFNIRKSAHRLIPLLKDSSPELRLQVIHVLGLLRIPIGNLLLKQLREDSSPKVAMMASWVAALRGKDEGIAELLRWLHHDNERWQLLAATLLGKCGSKGMTPAFQAMKEHDNPFVKLNLALALIAHRTCMEQACEVIYHLLQQKREQLWMWEDHFCFPHVTSSDVTHIDQIPNYPQLIDQKTRLDLLNLLCMMRYPKAQEAVKEYLQYRTWGITGAAMLVLLEGGDQEAVECVRKLLQDEAPDVRVQAAFILAMLGKDPQAIEVLQEGYFHVNRDIKLHILEAMGQVGDLETVPFLMDIFNEPFQLTRVVAASALIQCLYH